MLLGPCCKRLASSLGLGSLLGAARANLCAVPSSSSGGAAAAAAAAGAGRAARLQWRGLSSDASGHEEEVNAINEKFAEAREEIEFAREDAETVYFNESAEEARKAVGEVLQRWQALLDSVGEDEAARLQRTMGLKMHQLREELKALDELHA